MNNNVYAGGVSTGALLRAGCWSVWRILIETAIQITELFNPVRVESAIWYFSGTTFLGSARGPTCHWLGTGRDRRF